MSGTNFAITTEPSFCYQPFTCATYKGHLVVWSDDQTLWVKSFIGRTGNYAAEISTMDESDNIIFFHRFSKEEYIVAVETVCGYNLYFLNDNGNLCNQHSYTTNDTLVYCYQNDQSTILFIHNFDDNTMLVQTIPKESQACWNNGITTHFYKNVYGIPKVFVFENDNYTAGWITYDDQLTVVTNCVYNTLDASLRSAKVPKPTSGSKPASSASPAGAQPHITIDSYDVDYLSAACLGPDLIVYGGYDTPTNVLRLDYFCVNNFELLCSRYWKSDEYKGSSFSMASLLRGFMLLADGPDTQIRGQRFTHLGSWLYPMMDLDSGSTFTWSPDLAQGNEETLLVYIKDYGEHSEIWGKWLDISDIPELENLTLADVEK
uniref:Uncharacterized protein n=1 Tax=Marseillevirus LCMAC201 TaxID=2506605 RepID=A0A481YV71_9VIRU|nr:MAG: hypothetical protein LCMAC201_00850 [Marseillevirus LCMAC201]